MALSYLIAIILIGVCIGAAFIGFSAYAVSQRKMLFYLAGFSLCYAIEQCLIFFHEFLGQNLSFHAENFSGLEDPFLHLIAGSVLCECLWLACLSFFHRNEGNLRWVPTGAFIVLSILVAVFPFESDSLKKWMFYSIRQLFFLWVAAYCAYRYVKASSEATKSRYRSHALVFAVFVALVLFTLAEDTVVMLFVNPTLFDDDFILAYLYRRNTMEALLVLCIIGYTTYLSIQSLRLKSEDAPRPVEERQQAHMRDILPYFARKHDLTSREEEILAYLIDGEDNASIARRLQVSLGTVKTHTHHIFKKTGSSNRKELLQIFWSDR